MLNGLNLEEEFLKTNLKINFEVYVFYSFLKPVFHQRNMYKSKLKVELYIISHVIIQSTDLSRLLKNILLK